MNKLKPCPFCGGKATLLTPSRGHHEGGYEVHCFNNTCLGSAGVEDKQEMIDNWNVRAPLKQIVELANEVLLKILAPYHPVTEESLIAQCGEWQRLAIKLAESVIEVDTASSSEPYRCLNNEEINNE